MAPETTRGEGANRAPFGRHITGPFVGRKIRPMALGNNQAINGDFNV